MHNKIKFIAGLTVILLVLSCGWFKQKVEEKVDEEVKKTTEDINKQLKEADSLAKITGEKTKEEISKQLLDEEKILEDADGQWAIDAEASSSYSAAGKGKEGSWGTMQMTGKPDCESYGDNVYSWASAEQDKDMEWVKLTYKNAVYATEVRVRQNFNPGAIIRVELTDESGKSHTVWEGTDKTKYTPGNISWFTAKFDKTDYKTKKVKITLASGAVEGWNEIDAVQLVGKP